MYLFLYPESYINTNCVEEAYLKEYDCLRFNGFDVAIFKMDQLNDNDFSFVKDKTIIYRGWMFTIEEYSVFYNLIKKNGGFLITTPVEYQKTHYIPEWYPLLEQYTPKTHCFRNSIAARSYIFNNEKKYFVKDFVKSLRTGVGSFINSVYDFDTWVEESVFFKGFIEGGICLREVENFKNETENRFFIFNKKVYSNGIDIPDVVYEIIEKIDAPFYSVDIIQNYKNKYRLVEIGDGQVSSSETWNMINFVEIFKKLK